MTSGPEPPEPTGAGEPTPGLAVRPAQPMDLGQVVDAVIALYRTRPGLLLGICAILQVPAAILAGLILLPLPERVEAALGFNPFDPDITAVPPELRPLSTDQLLELLGPLWLAGLTTLVAGALTTVTIAHAVHRLRISEPASVAGAYRALLGRLGPALGALVAYTLGLIGLMVLAVLAFGLPISLAPGAATGGPLAFAGLLGLAAIVVLTIFVSLRWTFWSQAVIVDATGPLDSLRRSWRLAAGATWRVLGYTLLFGFAAAIIQGLLAQLGLIAVDVVGGILPEAVGIVLAFTVNVGSSLLLAPIVPVALTLLYLDLRVRRGEQLATGGAT